MAARNTELVSLAERATPAEWDFLTRVMLGELRTGALEGVLIDAIAKAAERDAAAVRRAAMLSGDLGDTAVIALTGTADELGAVGLVVGRPVMPMLASTASSVADALGAVTGEVSVEYKLDGARIQVHRDGDAVRVYTRNLADITHRVPEIVAAVRKLPARQVILDGETLSLDEDGGPRPFQDTMSRFGSENARRGRAAAVVLRRPPPRRRRSHRPAAVARASQVLERVAGASPHAGHRDAPIRRSRRGSRARRWPRGTRASWSRASTRSTRPAAGARAG